MGLALIESSRPALGGWYSAACGESFVAGGMGAILRGSTLAGPWTGGMEVSPAVGRPLALFAGKPLALTVSAFTNAMTCIGIVWFV